MSTVEVRVLSGCGSADAVERECPGSVKAKAGESVRCELSAGSVRYGLTATVSSYDNGKAQYEVKVDDKPAG
jgi:hypothetical protein